MVDVKLSELCKSFSGKQIINDMSIELTSGEFTVLVGPSGCGKSTLLRLIAGLETLDHGNVYFDGRDVSLFDPKNRDVAMVFQDYALYSNMNVFENMAFTLRQRKKTSAEIKRLVGETAEILGLETLLSRNVSTLSGGERQRVAIGRAFVRDPAVFLMDEPLSNLDAKLRVGMRSEIRLLHERQKTTTLFVTHDQVEAMGLGHRVAVLSFIDEKNYGNLQQVDRPEVIYARPKNLFVAGFIGSPEMNFFYANVEKKKKGLSLNMLAGANSKNVAIGTSIFTSLSLAGVKHPAIQQLQKYSGRDVICGIRPEDVIVNGQEKNKTTSRADQDFSQPFNGQFCFAENAGSEDNVNFILPVAPVEELTDFRRLIPPASLHPGETPKEAYFIARTRATLGQKSDAMLKVQFDLSKLHFFDRQSSERIG